MFCEKCGKELKEGSAFCAYCGAPVNGGAPRAASAETKKSKDKKRKPEPERQKKSGKGVSVAILIAAVLILAAGAGSFMYFTSDGYRCGKSMRAAAKYFEAGEYGEALACYEEALKTDNTLTEAYLKSADIYLVTEAFEDAVKIVEKGLKRTKEDGEAQAALTEKLAEVYGKASDYYLNKGNFAQAYFMLEEGIAATGAASLTEQKAGIYLAEAESALEEGLFEDGLKILNRGIGDTGSSLLKDRRVQAYLEESDRYLAGGDCLTALTLLTEGSGDTGDASLKEQESYLRENIVLRKSCRYENGSLREEALYDDDGRQTEYVAYDTAGRETNRSKTLYDEAGNTVSLTYDSTVRNQNGTVDYYIETVTDYRYDEAGGSRGSSYRSRSYYGNGDLRSVNEYDEETDEAGNVIKYASTDAAYDRNGNLNYLSRVEKAFVCEYDGNGNLTEMAVTTVTSDEDGAGRQSGNVTDSVSTYTWDGAGNPTGRVSVSNSVTTDGAGNEVYRSESRWEDTYEYDGAGNLLREVSSSRDTDEGYVNDCESEYLYEYDADGNRVKETVRYLQNYYDEAGNNTCKNETISLCEYDASGRMLRSAYTETVCDDNGELTGRTESESVYEYDEDGNQTGSTYTSASYDQTGRVTDQWGNRTETEYDADGNQISHISYDKDGNITSRTENTYDGQGNVLETTGYDESGAVSSRDSRTYDAMGNMLTRVNSWGNYQYTYEYIYVGDYVPRSGDGGAAPAQETQTGTDGSGEASGAEIPPETSGEAAEAPDYILPDSDSRFLTMEDLEGLSQEDCRIARNELFARHGRRFADETLQAYFDAKDWYDGTVQPDDFDDSVFNEYELANRDLITEYERQKGYR